MCVYKQGKMDQKYTVECPDGCRKGTEIWGCNPFMDESSICKAAIGMGQISDAAGGLVSFQLVEPEDHWDACSLKGGVTTSKWTWYEWKKALRPSKIKSKCTEEWQRAYPGAPCEQVIKKYRQNCKMTHGIEHCYGARAFKFLEPSTAPVMEPASGVFFGTMSVSITATTGQSTVCTTDGTVPNAADPALGTTVSGSLELSNDGTYLVKCQAISDSTGGSAVVERTYRILTVSPTPSFSPDGGTGVIGNLAVAITADLDGAVIRYTLDGTQATATSPVYTAPIEIATNGAVIHAISTHPKLDDSSVSTSAPYLVTAVPPVFFPDGGVGVGRLLVKVETRAGDRAYCSSDGSIPTSSSTRCDDVGFEITQVCVGV